MNLDFSENRRERDEHFRLALLESILPKTHRRKEIDLRHVAALLWRHKWLFTLIAIAITAASVALALYLPNEYTATAILEPSTDASSAGLGKLAGEFGGIAALGGINLPLSSHSDRPSEAVALILTQGFLVDFIRKFHLEVLVLAAKGWDSEADRLVISGSLYDVKEKRWVGKFESPRGESSQPNEWDLYRALRKRISVSQDKDTGLVTLSVEYYSPSLAKQWVDDLVSEINDKFETQDRLDAEKSIAYLQDQLERTRVADMRQVLYTLIEEQTRRLMMTEVSNGYVFKTLSAAQVPDKKSQPQRIVIVVLGAILGGAIALAVVLLGEKYRILQRRVKHDAIAQ